MIFNIWIRSCKFKTIQRIWQNTKFKSICWIQEVVKCFLFLIFAGFLWTHSLRSKPIIKASFCVLIPDVKTLSGPILQSKKVWSMIGKILLYIGKNQQIEVLANKYGSFQKQLGGLGWWQQYNSNKTLQFLPSFKLGNNVSSKFLYNEYRLRPLSYHVYFAWKTILMIEQNMKTREIQNS